MNIRKENTGRYTAEINKMSESDIKKTIKIGVDLINPYRKRGGRKTLKVKKPSSKANTFKLTSTKRELLNRIKARREEERQRSRALNIVLNTKGGETLSSENSNTKSNISINDESFESGFHDALKYLDRIRQEHREKKAKKKQKHNKYGGSNVSNQENKITAVEGGDRTNDREKVKTALPSQARHDYISKFGGSGSSGSSHAPVVAPALATVNAASQDNVIVVPTIPVVVPTSSTSPIPTPPQAVINQKLPSSLSEVKIVHPVPVVSTPAMITSPSSIAVHRPQESQRVLTPPRTYNQNDFHSSNRNPRLPPPPPYGNLKGGKLPTYRKYHTLKSNSKLSSSNTLGRQNGGKRRPTKTRRVKRKTIKRTYHLGRNKENNQLSVLIKNQAKNSKIKQEEGIIRNKSIDEVKKYLYDKNMIKIGTTAPSVILRKMYETSILAGDITNKNPKVRLHNFTSNSSSTY